MLCQWFAMCEREAAGIVSHPVLEFVPCCLECAARFDLELQEGTFTPGPDETLVFTATPAAELVEALEAALGIVEEVVGHALDPAEEAVVEAGLSALREIGIIPPCTCRGYDPADPCGHGDTSQGCPAHDDEARDAWLGEALEDHALPTVVVAPTDAAVVEGVGRLRIDLEAIRERLERFSLTLPTDLTLLFETPVQGSVERLEITPITLAVCSLFDAYRGESEEEGGSRAARVSIEFDDGRTISYARTVDLFGEEVAR